MPRWLIGMLLALVGCCCSSIGLVLMKHSTAVEADLPLTRRRFFFLGFVFLIVNASVIDVVAFSLAPITLIAPFTGVTIVITSFIASTGWLYVKETLDVYDTTSTGITLMGVLLTSLYGPHIDEVTEDVDVLYGYFFAPDFVRCMTILGVALAGGWVVNAGGLAATTARRPKDRLESPPGSPRPAANPTASTILSIMLYAYTAALAGAMSMLLLKVIGTGLFAAIEHDEPLLTPGWFFSFGGLAGCALVQLTFLNQTLANSPVSFGVPMYQALLTVLTILSGGIFFSELDSMRGFDFLVFSTGVGITLLGLALHSSHRSEVQKQQERQQAHAQAQAQQHAQPCAAVPGMAADVECCGSGGGAACGADVGGARVCLPRVSSHERTRLLQQPSE